MNKLFALALAVGLAAAGYSQVVLYAPVKSIADQQITLKSWGSGTIAETDEAAYEGNMSVRVSTRDLFQGGLIMFGAAPDLSAEYANKSELLQLTFRVADASMQLSSGNKGGGKGNIQVGSGGGSGAAGLPPKNPPPGQKGGSSGGGGASGNTITPGKKTGGTGATATALTPASPLDQLRIIVTTTDGLKSEAYVPAVGIAGENGWTQVGVPLQAISGFGRTNKKIASIAFAGDATSTFYIGDIRTQTDTTPITGDVNVHDLNLALGDEATLSAQGYAGASILRYSWNFDSAHSQIPDAEGQTVLRKFNKPGTYTITCTISDYYGLKPPYKATIVATVNP